LGFFETKIKTKDKIKTKNNLAEFYFLVARQTKYLSTTKIYQSRKQLDSHAVSLMINFMQMA
jgi:hypothetical protein